MTIIGIAGGTGSGKSTLTNAIKKKFGDKLAVIYHDNYYRKYDDLTYEERTRINYDHPETMETELLIKHLQELKEGRSILCPVYDFSQHNRSDQTVTVNPSKVLILEGIMVLHDSRLRDLCDIKIFVDSDADERILRRAARDMKERGRSLESIMDQYVTTVKPMHYEFVEPSRRLADLVVNGGMNPVAIDIISNEIRKLLAE